MFLIVVLTLLFFLLFSSSPYSSSYGINVPSLGFLMALVLFLDSLSCYRSRFRIVVSFFL